MDILSSILSHKVSQHHDKQSEFERVNWLVRLMKWMQRPRSAEEKITRHETVYTVRLKYILLQLNKNPDWKEHFVSTLTLLLHKISSPVQLTSAGLPSTHSFVQEMNHRIQEKLLPHPQLSEDLSTLIYEIFPHEDEILYIDHIDPEVLAELFSLFATDRELVRKLSTDVLTAAYLMSHQIQHHTLTILRELRLNPQPQDLAEFQLEGALREHQIKYSPTVSSELLKKLSEVEQHMHKLYETMKEKGIKIELVYIFQIQRRKLRRLRFLLQFITPEISSAVNFRSFISHMVLETQHQKSLISFFAENFELITERIVQTNSHIGEHYVTYTWDEFKKMFRSSLGGGGVTALTVYIKIFMTQLNLTGFLNGVMLSLNYSASFLTIQLMGWTLATKQPSTTALYIASALQKSTTASRKSIVALLRTQFVAVIGNLAMVFPLCFVTAWVCFQLHVPLMSSEEAFYHFRSTNILGPSAIFAAFTGVLLFAGSLIAGLFENWMIVNRIDKRIKYNERLQNYLGVERTRRLGQFFLEKANPLASNISLGFLLGLAPTILKFFGLPLEARHVTLATGGFAASLPMVLNAGVSGLEIANAASGILVIGILNLSVSFALAFLLASVSTQVKFSSFWRLLKWGLRLVLTRPWLLVVPEKQKDAVKTDH